MSSLFKHTKNIVKLIHTGRQYPNSSCIVKLISFPYLCTVREAWPGMRAPLLILHGEERVLPAPHSSGAGSLSHALQVVFITAANSSSGMLMVLPKLF